MAIMDKQNLDYSVLVLISCILTVVYDLGTYKSMWFLFYLSSKCTWIVHYLNITPISMWYWELFQISLC